MKPKQKKKKSGWHKYRVNYGSGRRNRMLGKKPQPDDERAAEEYGKRI